MYVFLIEVQKPGHKTLLVVHWGANST